MKFKTPHFWYRDQGTSAPLNEVLLSILNPLYAAGHNINQKFKTTRNVSIPVLCIGNITAGGSGKTPVALAVMDIIKASGLANNPHFLTRGYGSKNTAPVLVDPKQHTYKDVGDEALLLAQNAPVVVAKDRYEGALKAIENGADFIIMDDGLQNASLHKDISFVVVNGEMGFGNGKILPAGPLRESITAGLNKGSVVIMIGEDKQNAKAKIPQNMPVLKATIVAKTGQSALAQKANIIAFAGLGYPQKFFSFIKETYAPENLDTHSFADHHPYTEQDLGPLIQKAQDTNAHPVTTQKDYMRVPNALRPYITPLDIEVVFENANDVLNIVRDKIRRQDT